MSVLRFAVGVLMFVLLWLSGVMTAVLWSVGALTPIWQLVLIVQFLGALSYLLIEVRRTP